MLPSDREVRHFFVYAWWMLSSLVGVIACMLSSTYEAAAEDSESSLLEELVTRDHFYRHLYMKIKILQPISVVYYLFLNQIVTRLPIRNFISWRLARTEEKCVKKQ